VELFGYKYIKLLDDWWRASTHFIDSDNNDSICAEEYAEFHKRLFRLVEEDNGGILMTEEEKEAVMKDDFHVDSGGDGSVDREEFRFSIFQLADQWTCSVNADEYIAFLKRGYSIVFQDMIEADKLQWPLSWAEELKKVKSLTPMPIIRSVDIMTGILKGKLKADQVAATNNRAMITLEKYVIDYFKVCLIIIIID